MKTLMKSLLFGLAIILSIGETCFGALKYAEPGSRWKVTIVNYQVDSDLWVRCRSKDDDLGEHRLGIGEQYDWEFKENVWKTTLFWCRFGGKDRHATFNVFWPEKGSWLAERCNYNDCIWAAETDGIYLKNIPKDQFEFVHEWEPGS